MPENLRWIAVLPVGEDGALQPGTGLLDREAAPLEASVEIPFARRAVVLGYPADFVRPLPSATVLSSNALRPGTPGALNLPRPGIALVGTIDGDALLSPTEIDPGPVAADWVQCPANIGTDGYVLPSCLNCVGTLSQRGCELEADLNSCALEGFQMAFGGDGELSSLAIDEPRLGACTLNDSAAALSTVECEFPERAGSCEFALIPKPRPDPFDVLSLNSGPVLESPFGSSRISGGYLYGAAIVGPDLVVATTGTTPRPWRCEEVALNAPSTVAFVDRASFTVTRTATSAPCLRWPMADAPGGAGFLAVFGRDDEYFLGRFDASARVVTQVPLGSISGWEISDAVLLSPNRAVVALLNTNGEDNSRLVFVRVEPVGLSIELDHASSAGFISSLHRLNDETVAVLADSNDNFRVVSLEGERGTFYVNEPCGTANLSSSGFWMSDNERLAVAAYRENGTLLLLEPREGTCRFVRAPTHPETLDPIAMAQMGKELIVSFWGRRTPRAAFLGRLDLEAKHMLPAFTPVGLGVINRILVDGDVVYGTITDRAELVRLRPQP